MSGRKKFIAAFITIFILGLVTGMATAPLVVGRLVGNPYSDDLIARRVFNTNFINTGSMPIEKETLVNNLVAKYVSQYMVMKEKFGDQRLNLYAGFTNELKSILSENEYRNFIHDSDKSMKEREEYHREKASEWRRNRDQSKYYNKDYEEAARLMYAPRIPTGTAVAPINNNMQPMYNYGTDDIYQMFIIDKKNNNWKTFNESDVLRDANEDI